MLQQVNLYEPIFREDHKLFSATTICVGLGIVAAGLIAITLFSWWRVQSLDRQLRAVHVQETEQKKFMAQANAIVDEAGSHQTMEIHLQAMAVDLARRQQALRYLRGGDGGSSGPILANRGFVGRMTALAHQQVDGLWLTGATFVSGSDSFQLTGGALNADLVPIYLARLMNEPAIGSQIEFSVSSSMSTAP
jgi:hypothetical protein